jgi:hypothetical protein
MNKKMIAIANVFSPSQHYGRATHVTEEYGTNNFILRLF